MFLYTPKTDEQKENLILVYQTIINNPVTGFVNLLTSGYHFRYHFIGRHKKKKAWTAVLNWCDNFEGETRGDMVIIYIMIFMLYSYYALCWIPWMLRIFINYKKIRQEAPINLLELG